MEQKKGERNFRRRYTRLFQLQYQEVTRSFNFNEFGNLNVENHF